MTIAAQAAEIAITATGAIEPEAVVNVSAQQEGVVSAVRVREGDRVRAGQVLVEMDDRELRASLAEAEARRVEAEAQWKRSSALVDEGLIAPSEADAARASRDTAIARVDALRTRLSFTRLAAPVDGTVTARRIEVGSLAVPRTPLLELAAGERLILRVPVSELDVVKLTAGARATVTVDALPDVAIAATIARIFPAAAGATRQVTVELALADVPGGVRPGFLARARLVTDRLSDAILVPERAVMRGAEIPSFVYVVSEGTARVRPVEVGTRFEGRALLRSGVRAGDVVVVEGMGRLRDGASVAVQDGGGSGS
jgi:RND family efflux transporter MFP subunit